MKKAFVKTENYARFAAGVKAVEQRGAAEAGMMLVHGQPGYGKSHIVYRWAEEAGAVYLRANVDWTPKYFLVELCKALNIDGRGTAQALFERCLRVLVERQCPIIIDEAEFTLSSNAAVLEKVRDFSDRAEVTVIVNHMLGRTPDQSFVDRSLDRLVSFSDLNSSHWAFYPIMEASNSHDHIKAGGSEQWTGINN